MSEGSKKILLIVEDDKALRQALAEKCGHLPLDVITAKNGQEALTEGESHQPDLILLDIMMPEMDGIEFLRELRRKEWGKETEVIILTNQTDNQKISEALAEGALEYYVKSNIDLDNIAEVVKTKFGIL